ncbi:kazal-type serine peptidase inhibitor domain 2 [Chanos chanos]|uniref:Kazal-type serine peptidase inhibitor domain 2 n=1 Tax=Chanos chanos TaxID=29144 RepID=A0A6J2UPZ7_CHACN|nr:kazal-type serine protease inhibitor domain-containing protein 1-like [Chanos chanos]
MSGATGLLVLQLTLLTHSLPVKHLRYLDWQRSMSAGVRCPERCHPEQCPDLRRLLQCPAGRVRDACGCCWECGNGEGQLCDPDHQVGSSFYGRCAEGLRCRVSHRHHPDDDPKRVCVCARQEVLCGSDGKTYENVCQLRAAQFKLGDAGRPTVAHHGSCKAKPVITHAPRDIIAAEGSDVIFSCEVSSYPLASIHWRKEGRDLLPTDESNTAVQAHESPQRFELTGWLQIQAVRPDDEGVYTCAARNALGGVSASARLQVLLKDPQLTREQQRTTDAGYDVSTDEVDEDDEDYEGQPSGYMYL